VQLLAPVRSSSLFRAERLSAAFGLQRVSTESRVSVSAFCFLFCFRRYGTGYNDDPTIGGALWVGWDCLRQSSMGGEDAPGLAAVVKSLGICASRGLPFRLLDRDVPLPVKQFVLPGLLHPFSDEEEDNSAGGGGVRRPDDPHCLLSLERADSEALQRQRGRLLSGLDAAWLDSWYAEPASPPLTAVFLALCQAPRGARGELGVSYQGERALRNAKFVL
jgi:hypothetical protein